MSEDFENAFSDVQRGAVSVCLDLLEDTGKTADKAYIYLFQNDIRDFANAFFEKDGKVYKLNDWFSDEMIDGFFDLCFEAIEDIIGVCEEYDKQCPNIFKLIYDINSGVLDADYVYEDIFAGGSIGLEEHFMKWREDVSRELCSQ